MSLKNEYDEEPIHSLQYCETVSQFRGYARTAKRRERYISKRKYEADNLRGEGRCRGIMKLPSSHSLSVNKPSKAKGAACGDPGGGEIPMRPVITLIGASVKTKSEG